MEQQHDFTKGPILPLLLRFALPVIGGNLFQLGGHFRTGDRITRTVVITRCGA